MLPPGLPRHRVILGRGPFAIEAEEKLLREESIEMIVTKNSGGEATFAKLLAARALGLPVVMVARPPQAARCRSCTIRPRSWHFSFVIAKVLVPRERIDEGRGAAARNDSGFAGADNDKRAHIGKARIGAGERLDRNMLHPSAPRRARKQPASKRL